MHFILLHIYFFSYIEKLTNHDPFSFDDELNFILVQEYTYASLINLIKRKNL